MNFGNIYKVEKFKLVFLILFSIITIFHRLNESPLGYDDAHYAQRAKEMIKNNDYFYLNPTFGGNVSLDNKPPMVYWFLGIAGKIFGFKNWSMRIFPGIFGFLTVLMIYIMVFYITKDFTVSFFSAFILNFTQQFIYYSRSATPETIFNFFFWIAIFCFYLWVEKGVVFCVYIFGVCLGFAIMTRQFFGLVILPIIFVYLVYVKKVKYLLKKEFFLAFLVAAAISLPWHLVMILKHKNNFVNNYFGVLVRYTISREASWNEYVKKIFENYWPWLPFLILGLIKLKKINLNMKNFITLLLISAVLYLSLLHIPKFKAPQYLVVIYVPFSVFASYGLISVDKNLLIRKFLISLAAILLTLWIIFPIIPKTLDSNEYKELQKIFDKIGKIDKELITLDNSEFWHFKNGILFYLNKNVVGLKEEDFANSLYNGSKNYYILKWKDFYRLIKSRNLNDKVVIISSQSESVLFSNYNF